MFRKISLSLLVGGLFHSSASAQAKENLTWEELREQYQCPAWFAEAKFGIWAHWGAQSVPEWGGGWYAKHMYMKDVGRETFGKRAYEHHLKTYGHPSEKGFKDVIHTWKAEKFDSDHLVSYFKSLGARYFVALANHHDHFDNFDSTHQEWNSVRVGPKRDIIGEFQKSAKKFGLPFGVSSHDDRFLKWWLGAFESDQEGPKKGIPYDGRLTKEDGKGTWWEGMDPANLYGLPPEKRTPEWIDSVGKNFADRHLELVTKYEPDFLWFDGYGFPYEKYGKQVCTEFYNQSLRKHGKINAVVSGKFTDEPSTIKDIERGVADKILAQPWQGTTTFTSWFLKKDKPIKHSARSLVEVLCDIISKNGNFLLNVEMYPDGSIPPDHKAVLDGLGAWVNQHADAIYATKPWKIHGDNLNSIQRRLEAESIGEADIDAAKKNTGGHFNERIKTSPPYGHDEVRFTTKGDILYIFVLNPKSGDISLPALGLGSVHQAKEIAQIQMLKGGAPAAFTQTQETLSLTIPESSPKDLTMVFQVRFK